MDNDLPARAQVEETLDQPFDRRRLPMRDQQVRHPERPRGRHGDVE
jgi:hypothetical protein